MDSFASFASEPVPSFHEQLEESTKLPINVENFPFVEDVPIPEIRVPCLFADLHLLRGTSGLDWRD